MDVEEMNIQDLFEDEARDPDDPEEEDENADQDTSEAQLELGGKGEDGKGPEIPKKRIIRNPQPKLDPDRILGPRGVPILEKVFADFKPKGKGEEFRDLDIVMKRMEHWAHRLYPKLPFDDVMNRISILGKKKTVQVNLKKIRRGMDTFVQRPPSDDEDEQKLNQLQDDGQDATKRYDDDVPEDDDALFDQMMKEVQERERSQPFSQRLTQPTQSQNKTLNDEQRERMLRNRQIAEEKRKAKIRETERLQNESQEMTTQENDAQTAQSEKDKPTEVETQRLEEKENTPLDDGTKEKPKNSLTSYQKESEISTKTTEEEKEKEGVDTEMTENENINKENDDSLSDEDMLHIAE